MSAHLEREPLRSLRPALFELGRALVPRLLRIRRRGGAAGRIGRPGHRRHADGHGHRVRRRVLEPDSVHHADGFRGDRRLRSGQLAARRETHRPAGAHPAQWTLGSGLGGTDLDGGVAAQLGPVSGVRRLLVRALARRTDLRMDYRAAGAAAYLGLGAVWALGLSSSAAQLQANPASLPPSILSITGVIPFTQTIFLWQSGVLLLALVVVSLVVAYATAPGPNSARDAQACGRRPGFQLAAAEQAQPTGRMAGITVR